MKKSNDDIMIAQVKLEKQINQEKLLKQTAVNKLAEIMNRKDTSKDNRKNKVRQLYRIVKGFKDI